MEYRSHVLKLLIVANMLLSKYADTTWESKNTFMNTAAYT